MFGASAWPPDLCEVGGLEVGVRLTLLFYDTVFYKMVSYIDLLLLNIGTKRKNIDFEIDNGSTALSVCSKNNIEIYW